MVDVLQAARRNLAMAKAARGIFLRPYTRSIRSIRGSSMAHNRTDVSDAAHPKGVMCHLLCAEDKPHENARR
jgi:hypothetical protein